MAVPTIVTRAGKGSALTFTEADTNFTNLRDATLSVTDGSNSTALNLNDTLTFTAGSNMTVTESAGTITLAASLTSLTGSLDMDGNSITDTNAGPMTFIPAAGQFFKISQGEGIDLSMSTPVIKASATNEMLEINTNGLGSVYFTNGLLVGGNYGASGYTVITGQTSAGVAIRTNNGAAGANDPQLALTSGGGISVTAGATSTTTFNGTNVSNMQLKDYKETVYTGGSTTGTITPDVANGNVQAISLTGNITFNAFANPEAGQSMTLIIDTNGTGRTLTSTMKFAGGNKTLSTTDTTDILSVFYDGTTYWASLATDFS